MTSQTILSTDYLDLIFNGRNKNYGAYELRRHYHRRALKATLSVVSVLLLITASYSYSSRFRDITATAPVIERTYDITRLQIEVSKPPIAIPQPVAAPPPSAPSVTFTTPKLVPDELANVATATKDDLLTKEPGTVDSEGKPNGIGGATGDETGDGIVGNASTGPGIVPPASSEPVIYVEQMPEFDGNINQYLAKNIQYPQMARDSRTTGRVVIRFVVNEDGSVSNPVVLKGIGSGCEEEAMRVIRSMPKWKPGKQNGKAVKVYFTLPVNFFLG